MAKVTQPIKVNSAPAQDDAVHIRAPRSVVVLLCVLLPFSILAVGLAGFWLGWRARRGGLERTLAVQTAALNRDKTAPYRAKPGPWGELECIPIFIEIPDEYLSVRAHEADVPRWFFGGYTPQTLTSLFEAAGLSAQQKTDLMDSNKWEVRSEE